MDRSTTLQQIQAGAPPHLVKAATHWLSEAGIEQIAKTPGEIEAAEAAKLWRIRALHVSQAGKQLIGAHEFIAELETLNPSKQLYQYSFHGTQHSGSVFFEKASRKYVGLVIVERADQQFASAAPSASSTSAPTSSPSS